MENIEAGLLANIKSMFSKIWKLFDNIIGPEMKTKEYEDEDGNRIVEFSGKTKDGKSIMIKTEESEGNKFMVQMFIDDEQVGKDFVSSQADMEKK